MDEARLPYSDRAQAGRILAGHLEDWRDRPNLLVLGLPRGGVAVAFEVAHALQAPLDIFVVRKLGFPGHEEYAMGAIASGGVRVMNPLQGIDVAPADIVDVVAREEDELRRRELLYRGERPAIALRGRDVIVVDDGLATGATMRAAVEAIRQQHPLRMTVAVPMGAAESCKELVTRVDGVVCPAMPTPFHAVGIWYRDFPQTTDDDVHRLLDEARRERAAMAH